LKAAVADQNRYELIGTFNGIPRSLHVGAPGFNVIEFIQQGVLKPNDLIRPAGSSGFFLYAHQTGLFTAEQLAGVELKEDNLPEHLRGRGVRLKSPFERLRYRTSTSS
jgi:hypothetical protein